MSPSTSMFSALLAWLSSLFFSKTAEIAVVGLQNSGKTSFVNRLCCGQWSEGVVPTVAFNLTKVKKGAVTFKIWDLAGQPKFRSMWERYCHGIDAIIFVVDSSTRDSTLVNSSQESDKFRSARWDLHHLIAQPGLAAIPLLVLGNKNDIPDHASVEDLIHELELDKIQQRAVSCYSCSVKTSHNLDIILRWLTERGH